MNRYTVIEGKTRKHTRPGWLLALTLALTVTGCGGSTDSSPPAEDPQAGTPPVVAPPPVATPEPTPTPAPDLPEPEFEAAPQPVIAPLPPADTPSVPAPPSALLLSATYNRASLATPINNVIASSSGDENDGNSADKAVDGNLNTRWESAWSNTDTVTADSAWLQFDFGDKTAIGYMKLHWENAYGEQYALYISDDAQNWYQLRYISGASGGTKEFFNLNANVRYLRLQGIRRHTQYGYSLFEVEFKTPGSDTVMPVQHTSYLTYPLSGSGSEPLPAPAEPVESISFTLADGTLVTRFGMVGRSRHARERGEDWNEIGFGANDTVDAQGNPADKGPGAHLNFVANYFKNRTWGVEFIDNSNVAGVTAPQIIVNQYFQQAQKGGGHSFVRRFDEPGVTGFGWMSPGDLLDDSTYLSDGAPCPVVAKPANNVLLRPDSGFNGVIGANDGCSVVFDTYPGHRALSANADGVLVPNGNSVAARPLKKGDVIEFTSSFFSTREVMDAIGDNGGVRYYTNELTYVMGQGLRPWYGVQPRLLNQPLPDNTLQGGLGSISYDYADNPSFMFQQPHNTIGMQNIQRFMEGRRWLHTNLWTGEHNEPGNDRNDAGRYLQGAHFNQSSCFNCHIGNGHSVAPTTVNQRLDTMAVRVAESGTDSNGNALPHPVYGQALQMNARSTSTGVRQNWGNGAWVAGFDSHEVMLADGTVVELHKPRIAFEGPVPGVYSVRSAQPLIGMGLLEAIADETILSWVRSIPDADGVLGTANYGYDPETGDVRLGRYGWKAAKVSLRHQVANAALLDMSVTSSVYPTRLCLYGPQHCDASNAEPGLPDEALQLMTQYLQLLGVPAQRSVPSGFPNGVSPLPYLDVAADKIAQGEQVFKAIRCNACHISDVQTSARSEFAEVRNQRIKPYTDLLLHDMGAGLADNFAEGLASGSMWRTPPLWGLGYTRYVADGAPVGYLHDSRARTLTEAILWHGGEAEVIKNRFVNLPAEQRDALLAFLQSL